MPTAREIRVWNEQDALIAAFEKSPHGHLLDEHKPERLPSGAVVIGPLEVMQGASPDKPVIRDVRTKRVVEGSGRFERANDPVLTGKASGYRKTKEYRDARERFEELFPLAGDPEDRGSMAWFFDEIWQAAQGSPQYVDCPHPDTCPEKNKKHVVAFKKDAALLFKMMELRVGKAPQTLNINSKEEKIVEALEHRVYDIRIQGLSDTGTAERQKVIESFGYVIDGKLAEPEPTATG